MALRDQPKTLEEAALLIKEKAKGGSVSIEQIVKILSGRGRLMLLILLSVPFCLPIQVPGLSAPFGIAIAFTALRIMFGRRVWLPKSILRKKIKGRTIEQMAGRVLRFQRRWRKWNHPRLEWISSSRTIRTLHVAILFFLGVFLFLPLVIPFSNLAPAWAILLIGFGLLENDGLFILFGDFIALAGLVLCGASIYELIRWL